MGEALMFRAGGGSEGMGGGGYELVTHVIETNQSFVMPENVKNNQVYVRIFGAGGKGGGYNKGGGGGGWMNNGWITLNPGSSVYITIGNSNGASSSFGTYLSANGGSNANNSWGGSGGSGGGSTTTLDSSNIYSTGYQFGGGGGKAYSSSNKGGRGGNYFNSPWGGGDGGSINKSADNGINTISIISETDSINSDGIGYGLRGNGNCAGGGGYGANGGIGSYNPDYKTACSGGGGGYGAAGYGGSAQLVYKSTSYWIMGGGGGSYGHGAGWNYASNGYEIATYGGGGAGVANSSINKGAQGICLIWYYKKT